MRQIGFLAAAGSYALDHHLDRLADDHANPRALADVLASTTGLEVDPSAVDTNIVIARLAPGAPDAATRVARARDAGVLVLPFSPRTIRATTHLGVDRRMCVAAAEILAAQVRA